MRSWPGPAGLLLCLAASGAAGEPEDVRKVVPLSTGELADRLRGVLAATRTPGLGVTVAGYLGLFGLVGLRTWA